MRRRMWVSQALSVLNSIIPVVIALAIGAILIWIIGNNPLTTYQIMFSQTLFNWGGLLNTIHYATPLILTGLAIAVTFRASIFNMGVEGQLLGGAFAACVLGFSVHGLPSIIQIGLCLVVGILVGILFALVPAILKAYFGVNEIVVTLMLNYAIAQILQVLTQTIYRDPAAGYVATPPVDQNAMFTRLPDTSLTLFTPIVLIVFAVMYVTLQRSRLGYEITAIGINPDFAEASGMNIRRKIIVMFVISGALSGLAGAGWLLSQQFRYTLTFSGSPGLGWDGMLVSLLGGNSPIGILIAAILYAALKTGANAISIFTNVPNEIVGVIQALVILLLAIRYIEPSSHQVVKDANRRVRSRPSEEVEA